MKAGRKLLDDLQHNITNFILHELIKSIQGEQAFELDDDAIANITGEPSGPF